MARLIWDGPAGQEITFASTNRFLRFALAWAERVAYASDADSPPQHSLSSGWDAFLPREFDALSHKPVQNYVRRAAKSFFAHQGSGGLITCQIDDAAWPRIKRCHREEAREEAQREFKVSLTHHLGMLRRMIDFLEWFPEVLPPLRPNEQPNPPWPEACMDWADAIVGDPPHSHRAADTSDPSVPHRWRLCDYVVTEPPENTPNVFSSKVQISHGLLPRALERLAHTLRRAANARGGATADELRRKASEYEAAARSLAWEMWTDRPNQAIAFPSDCVSGNAGHVFSDANNESLDPRHFVLPGDRPFPDMPEVPEEERRHYTLDTDLLYWARIMYKLYEEAYESWRAEAGESSAPTRPDLRPPRRLPLRFFQTPFFPGLLWTPRLGAFGRPLRFLSRRVRLSEVDARRTRLSLLLEDRDGIPEAPIEVRRYLYMALAVTIDWFRGAWNDEWDHFSRKVFLQDGDRATYNIYGDGMWNTLYLLVDAYRFTGDSFYLDYFKLAWETLRRRARDVTHWSVPVGEDPDDADKLHYERWLIEKLGSTSLLINATDRQGLFHPLVRGQLSTEAELVDQDPFIDLMLKAHQATETLGHRDQGFLHEAERLADLAISKYELAYRPDPSSGNKVRPQFAPMLAPKPVLSRTATVTVLTRLALARGPLYRVAIQVPSEGDIEFVFKESLDGSSPASSEQLVLTLHVEHTLAVVYMDPGRYGINLTTGTAPLDVRIDRDHSEGQPLVLA